MDTDAIERLIGRLYTSFIMRDLAFMISGGIVTAVVVPRPIDALAAAISQDKQLAWLAIPAFLGVAYVLGMLLQEAGLLALEHLPRWWKNHKAKDAAISDPLVVRMEMVHRKCSPYTVLGVERILFLKQIAATQFITLIVIGIALLLCQAASLPSAWPIYVLLIGGALLCVWIYRYMATQQERILTKLEESTAYSSSNKSANG